MNNTILLSSISSAEYFATACFVLAILHTFSVKQFQHLATKFKEGSVSENLFHLLGEVEVVFGLWAAIFISFLSLQQGTSAAVSYLESHNFTEPAFVFVIMVVCSTRPILEAAAKLIEVTSRLIPVKPVLAFYFTCLVVGPLLGSFITEPAAMTVTALILLERFYKNNISLKLKYATIGLLFVNISIGGTLTPFAAPPVLMVAGKWGWDLNFMLTHFGWKAAIAIILSTFIVSLRFRSELLKMTKNDSASSKKIETSSASSNLKLNTPF
ncbi:MAG: putative Na+/H+ antiporter, partial [Bdellovibrionales bacterium]